MSDEDRAAAHRHAFARHSAEAVSAATLWCRAADIDPEEKAEAVRRVLEPALPPVPDDLEEAEA